MKYIERAVMWISCAVVACFGMYTMKNTDCIAIMFVPVIATIFHKD